MELTLNEMLNSSDDNDLEIFSYWEIGKSSAERICWENAETKEKELGVPGITPFTPKKMRTETQENVSGARKAS